MELPYLYPAEGPERDRWILNRRPGRNPLDPDKPFAFMVEDECSHTGEVVPTATVFLTNRECPWRCVMCDLWKNTLTERVPVGAIRRQIVYALSRLPAAKQIKLYNSGSFFDSGAIPPGDYREIASAVHSFERVVVESHPSLIGDRCLQLRDLVQGQLEVAMGLETVHLEALKQLNKRLTLELFADATDRLQREGISLRVFVLVQPPFVRAEDALFWTQRSLDFAFACQATAVTLIPTRAGNGAVDALAVLGAFQPPKLSTVEAALTYGLSLARGRVFVDLWDVEHVPSCAECRSSRMERLRLMNLSQQLISGVPCTRCGGTE